MIDLMDLHTHTVASGHAYNTIWEMAAAAAEKGLPLLGIADHGPAMPGSADELYFRNFKMLPREVHGVKLMFGCELNILDDTGAVDLSERALQRLDYTIASIHGVCYENGGVDYNTRAVLAALENPYVTAIGHPDDSGFPVDYERIVPAAKKHHKLLELNSNSLNPRCSSRSGGPENCRRLLEVCRRYEQPILIGSDAHSCPDVHNHARALALLEELDFPAELVVNTSLEAAAEFIPFLGKLLRGELTELNAIL